MEKEGQARELGQALASNAVPDSAAPPICQDLSFSVAPLEANCLLGRGDWVLFLGPFTYNSGGGVETKPQFKFGGQVGKLKAEAGIGDVRDGLKFEMRAQAFEVAIGHGNSFAELYENTQCETPGFKEALEKAKKMLGKAEGSGSALVRIAGTLGIPTMRLERLLAGEVAWPESLKSVKLADGVMELHVKAHVGVGTNWMACLGWCDTKGYHMMGVGMEASAVFTAGGHVFAGKHKNGDGIRIILGIGNFSFEYTCPLDQEALEAEPAALADDVGNAGSSSAPKAMPEAGSGLVVAPVPPAAA